MRHLIINYIHSPYNTLVQKSKCVYLVCLFVLVYFLLTYPKKYLYIYIYIYKQKPQGGAATLGKKAPYNADSYTAFK